VLIKITIHRSRVTVLVFPRTEVCGIKNKLATE